MKKAILLFGIVFFCAFQVEGQSYPQIYDADSDKSYNLVPNYITQIGNYVVPNISFSLSFDAKNWKNYSAKKNDPIWFDLRNGSNKDRFRAYFRVCTSKEKDCSIYKLQGKNRYRIFWNTSGEKWDLSKM